ncbi:OmpA family protein [Paraburkholderia sp. GAS33]|uniref:OmpA family protein n=1 Tax=Paraburkholderia sp. GAS33 TaxID=3035130 RepID=UPI003D1AE068
MKKIALCWLTLTTALGGCSATSGPTFSAYSVNVPGQEKTYRVDCGGIFESSKTCMKVAQRICGDQPVRVVESVDKIHTDGADSDPRTITFQCGAATATAALGAVSESAANAVPSSLEFNGEANFMTDRANLAPAGIAKLSALLAATKDTTFANVTVNGYTDSRGTRAHNMDLSQRRADTVLNYLKDHGMKSATYTAHGFGTDNPAASNATPEGRAKNRRVTIVLR